MSDYTVADYVGMLADGARMGAYTAAIRRHVRPGSVVVDLGAGPGVFALLAARLGARVHAIDPNDAVLVLHQLAREAGLSGQIVVHHADSRTVEIGERADLVVADIRGTLPLLGPGLSCVMDASRRFLREGGVLLPQRDLIRAAPVRDPSLLDSRARPWRGAAWAEGLELEPLARFSTSTWARSSLHAPQLALPPETLTAIEYRTLETDRLRGSAVWRAQEATKLSGFAVWFDATIDGDLGYSNAPLGLPPEQGAGRADSVYGTAFFPLGDSVGVRDGESIKLVVTAVPTGSDHNWTWRTEIGGTDTSPRLVDEQSTFFAGCLSTAGLRKRADAFRPAPTEAASAEREALSRFGTGDTLGDIARLLTGRFPRLFPSYSRGLDFAADLSVRLAETTQVTP